MLYEKTTPARGIEVKRTGVIVLAVIAIVGVSTVRAQRVHLQHSFLGGYKYSLDGTKFYDIGSANGGLAAVIGDDARASGQLATYRAMKNAGRIIGVIGTGAATVGAIWTVTDSTKGAKLNPLLYAGIGAAALGSVIGYLANPHIVKAVRIFNEGESAIGVRVPSGVELLSHNTNVRIEVVYHF